MDDFLDTVILQLRAIWMITVERFYIQMFLDSATAVTATEAIAQYSSSFSKGFKIKQRNNIFESFVAVTVQIKVFVAPDFS